MSVGGRRREPAESRSPGIEWEEQSSAWRLCHRKKKGDARMKLEEYIVLLGLVVRRPQGPSSAEL